MPSILIVGLGNPGTDYQHTRHNIGWEVLDVVEGSWHVEKKFKAEIATQGQVVFCKPQTYMNLSGEAVQALANYYQIPTHRIIVIYDDKDLLFGVIRVRSGGSSGGHNGVQSIIERLGTDQFGRIRIGIKPDHPIADTANFVLGRFSPSERTLLPEIISAARTVLDDCISSLTTTADDTAKLQHQDVVALASTDKPAS